MRNSNLSRMQNFYILESGLSPHNWEVTNETDQFLFIRERRGACGMKEIKLLDKKALCGITSDTDHAPYKQRRREAA